MGKKGVPEDPIGKLEQLVDERVTILNSLLQEMDMALDVFVERVIARTRQASVNYLIEDDSDGTVVFRGVVLRGEAMADPAGYGEANAAALFASGRVVADGAVRIEALRDRMTDELREEALRLIRVGIRNGDTLGEILSAVSVLYAEQTGIVNFLTDAVQIYGAGTAGEQRQFNIVMFYLLFAG